MRLRISEQRATLALYCINWLVFITEVESVYCAVSIESLHNTDMIHLWRVNLTLTVLQPVRYRKSLHDPRQFLTVVRAFVSHFDSHYSEMLIAVPSVLFPSTLTLFPFLYLLNLTFWRRTFFQILAHSVFKNVSNTETKQGSITK